jgi:PAS domain S-box-containing protein
VEARVSQYAEIAKLFGYVLAQYRLYSEKHPACCQAVGNFCAKLEQILASEPTLTLGFVGGRLLANDVSIDNKITGVAELLRESQRFQVESLIFTKGVTESEISAFYGVLALPPKVLEERGGLARVFEGQGLSHVKLGTARYRMVKEDQAVVDKSRVGENNGDPQAAEEAKHRVETIAELFEHCRDGKFSEAEFDFERLIYELERKYEGVVEEILRQASDLETLRQVVDLLSRFVVEKLFTIFVANGTDFSPAIGRLARALRKRLEASAPPKDFREAADEAAGVLEQCADRVKLELLIRAFEDSGRDMAALTRAVEKFLRSPEAWDKLVSLLRERLQEMGVGKNDIDRALAEPPRERTLRSPRKVPVSADEQEELRRLKERFEEAVAERVAEATAALEREKRRLQNEKERIDSVIRNLAAGLVVVDVEGKIQVMNPAAEKLLGFDPTEGRGVGISQVLKEEHLLALAKGPFDDDSDRLTKEIELRSVDDETRRVLQASSAVIENEEGKTIGMVSVLSDITKQKELDAAKSKFVAHVSHELRTPLVAIDESLAILMREEAGSITPTQEQFLGIARRNISRLSRLVNDLLDVAKLEAGKLDLRPTTFPVTDLVHHVVETVRNWANERGINLEEKYPEQEIALEADPDRLIQVMTNLMGNAVKFTPDHGKISVEVDGDWADPEISLGPCVAIRVQDSGIGIPKQDQERIFKKFEQVSIASADGMSSTGLGLTIAREIVMLHGGKIWVDSNQGEGACFSFAIPQKIKDRIVAPRRAAENRPATSHSISPSSTVPLGS